ncbi:MAG: PASTA domain-containing protein, partial [Roseiflexaceae bacterium]|nr:PASTA domain-containing protein [Roseiflexaceae bacterium]
RPRPQPRPRPVSTSTTAGRATLPPRSSIPAPRQSGGLGFGGFLLGLLLIGGVLTLVGLLASGALAGLLPTFPSGGFIPSPVTPTLEVPTAAPIQGTAVPQAVVPSIIGLDKVSGVNALTTARLTPQEDPPINSDFVEVGRIIDQFPTAGQVISETSVVTYVVSLGQAAPQVVEIPDVTRQRADVATNRLQREGFVVERQEEANALDEGFVIRTSPSPGLFVPAESTVTIVVSIGNNVTMPDVFRLSEGDARARIEAAGLVIGNVEQQSRDKLGDQFDQFAPGSVVSTDPRGGARVPRGTTVNLGVRAAE